MAINTEIWGEPEDWGLKTENFGASRSPTSSEDEQKYPPFYTGLNGTGILYSYAGESDYSQYFENPTGHYDPSCAYIGIQGRDLPQFNIKAYVYQEGGTLIPREYATLDRVFDTVPFTFAECWFDQTTFDQYAGNIAAYLTGFDGYRLNDNTIKNQQKTFHYSPDSTAHPYNINFNQLSAPVLNFGTKSVILVPYITLSESGAPIPGETTTYSLGEFSQLTQAQIDEIYLLRVFCRVYVRTRIGGYSYQQSNKVYMYPQFIGNWRFTDFDVDGFSDNLALARCTPTMNCELPVFGALVDLNYFSRIATSNYDSPIWSSHACIVLTNDKWEPGQLTSGTYAGAIYGNLKKEGQNYKKSNIIEMVRRAVAAYGLFWIEDPSDLDLDNISDSDFFNPKMFVGIIDDDGLTHGDYSNGFQNILTNNFQWSDVRESTYDPYTPHPLEPSNDYDYRTGSHTIGNLATLTKRYILNDLNVKNLGAELWRISADLANDDPSEPFKNYDSLVLDTFLTNNPIDCIISLQRFPMAIPHTAEVVENIKLGKITSAAAGYPMNRAAYEYSFTRKTIAPKFGNSFLDYEPYTQFEMYIPFCGCTKIDPADILNRELWCKLIVDFCTGTCTGYIFSNDLLIQTVQGNIAIQIPVTGTDTITLQGQLMNGITTYEKSKLAFGTSMAGLFTVSGAKSAAFNPANAAQKIGTELFTEAQNAYNLTHTAAPIHTVGSASPVGLWACDLDARLYCYYPTGDVINERGAEQDPIWNEQQLIRFGELYGYATAESGIISNYKGLVVCANPRLDNITTANGAAATAEEIRLIQSALAEGIINNT